MRTPLATILAAIVFMFGASLRSNATSPATFVADLNFEPNSSSLAAGQQRKIAEFAAKLRTFDGCIVSVSAQGHAGAAEGAGATQLKLARSRGEALVTALHYLGIEAYTGPYRHTSNEGPVGELYAQGWRGTPVCKAMGTRVL